ncbi:MAG TPA: CoA transferase, partial [Myxococcota bacterium]|nr:CoA transferase [Myxococcota bacterium]
MLVDAGARVVKVETGDGDPLRRWTSSRQALGGRDGALFQFLNGGKQGVLWDLASEAGRDKLLRLVQTADLVVESFGPGGLERSGLDFETLRARRPEVSLLSISPWGLEGPWAERPSTEFTLQAELGGPAYRGLPERGPVAAAGRVGEWAAGAFAAVAALAAWRGARTSGRGDHVDLSIFESMITCMTTYHDLFGQWFGVPLAQA